MWLIGVNKGIITGLFLIAYSLVVDLLHLQTSIWGHLEHLILAICIYKSHDDYQQSYENKLSYLQALKLNFIVVTFTSLVNSVFIYLMSRFVDGGFMYRLLVNIKTALKKQRLPEEGYQKLADWIEHILTPTTLAISVFISTCLVGITLSLIIAAFVQTKKKNL
jgi:hypothetical protein